MNFPVFMANDLFILGLIILVGFAGNVLYKKTKIPESIFLIIMGILFGPVFKIIQGQFFLDNAPFFLNLALVVVLLNCGLSIDVKKTLKNTPLAFLFTFIVLIITTGIIVLVTTKFFGWPLINGLFLGVLGFGTELITISHILDKINIGENTKTLIILESIINDIILITVITILLMFVTKSAGTTMLRVVVDMFFLSALLGIVFAIIWLYLFVRYIHGNSLQYIFTLGAALFIFDIMGSLGFNGAICVLVFSLTLGNYRYVLNWLKDPVKLISVEDDVIMVEGFNNQITFLIRTLFFFFVGLIFNISVMKKEVIFFVLIITAVLLLSRFLAAGVLSIINPRFKNSIFLFTAMAASGFIDTLLAIVAVRAGVTIPNLTEIILLIVIFTTLTSLISEILLERYYENNPTY